MKTLFCVLFAIVMTASIFAQSSASGNATVAAQLKAGLSISLMGGSLDFGPIVLTGIAQTPVLPQEMEQTSRLSAIPAKT